MKPFDLEKALAGEPVVLNNGNKAHIVGKVKSEYDAKYCLVGYLINKNGSIKPETWDITGSAGVSGIYKDVSIQGMWEEPKPKRYVNGIEVPEPVTVETWIDGKSYWYVDFATPECVRDEWFYIASPNDRRMISQGLVFETKEDAEVMTSALLNHKIETK